jgi:hypothetical protein
MAVKKKSLFDLLQGQDMLEKDIQKALIAWFKTAYPNTFIVGNYKNGIQFYSTTGKTPFKLLKDIKDLEGDTEGHPDLQIYEPRGRFHACFVELKTHNSAAFTSEFKDNRYELEFNPLLHFSKNQAELKRARLQYEYGLRLRSKDYFWSWGIGLKHAQKVITNYMES